MRATGQERVQGEQNGLKHDEKAAAPTDDQPKGEWLLAFWMAAWPRPRGRSTSDPCAKGVKAVGKRRRPVGQAYKDQGEGAQSAGWGRVAPMQGPCVCYEAKWW